MDEVCRELHSLKHHPAYNLSNYTLGQRLAAQSLPMTDAMVATYVKRQILTDQHTLVKLLKGEQGLHELLNVTVVDSFREETRQAIQECSDQIADVILARLLVGAVAEVGKIHDLRVME